MKAFNPEKELNKIQKGNKNKIILFVISLLIVGIIGYSFALYQVRYSKRIIYTKVAPFSNKDINLAVYLDNNKEEHFPEKNSGYRYDHIDCDNGSTATFDNINWALNLKAKDKDKCDVYFVKTYKDASGANAPELYQGLIPVTFDSSGNVKVADIDTSWYNYGSKQWANAVLVDSTKYNTYVKNGEYQKDVEIPMSDILQMYVWIPRYKYQLFNVDNEGIDPQEIQIQFENNELRTGTVSCTNEKGREICSGAIKGAWYTHPAFTFGNTELTGIWVGKFESSGTNTNVKVIPNVTPILNQNVSYMFNASRNIEEENSAKFNLNREEIDTHMMKNMEWGAMAYLTQSKYGRCDGQGKCTEVTRNAQKYATGYDDKGNLWNIGNGQLASTTGNMYGIYDTSGDAWEYVMGNMVDANGDYYASLSGLTFVDEKYYDKYEYDANSYLTHRRGHLGDATRETLQTFGAAAGAWYGAHSVLPSDTYSWFRRGGWVGDAGLEGTFASIRSAGEARDNATFRVILTAQDGNS